MAAQPGDKFKKVGASTVTSLAAPGKAIGATSITVGSTTNHPLDTGTPIAIRVVDTAGALVPGTYTEWNSIVTSATSFTLDPTPIYGSDQVYAAGSSTQVYIPVSSSAHNQMVDGLLIEHNQDGSHGAVTATSLTVSGAVSLPAGSLETADYAVGSVTSPKMKHTLAYSHLTSNLVQSMGAGGNFAISNTANFSQISITPAVNSNIFVMAAVNWQRDAANTGLAIFMELKQGGTGIWTGNVMAAQQIIASQPIQGAFGQFASTTGGLVTLTAGTTYTLNLWGNIQIGVGGNATFLASGATTSNNYIGYYLEAA